MSKIGVIGAMPVEIERLVQIYDAVQDSSRRGTACFYQAKTDSHSVIFACSSVGKVNAGACAQRLIDVYGVDYMINTGIAGAISGKLKTCDVVVGEQVFYHDFNPSGLLEKYSPYTSEFKADPELMKLAEKACQACPQIKNFILGRIATGDCFVEDSKTVAMIREQLRGDCVEMEGAAIGHVCTLNRVPFVVIRSISDFADESAKITYDEFEKLASLQASYILEHMINNLK